MKKQERFSASIAKGHDYHVFLTDNQSGINYETFQLTLERAIDWIHEAKYIIRETVATNEDEFTDN